MTKIKILLKMFCLLLLLVLSGVLIACTHPDLVLARQVDVLIEKLPMEITLEDETLILEARTAYELLTDEQKKLVERLDDLKTAEATLRDLDQTAANKVIDLIAALPAIDELKSEDKKAIRAARDSYHQLIEDQKALVTNITALEALEARMIELEKQRIDQEKAGVVNEMLLALPGIEGLTLEDASRFSR